MKASFVSNLSAEEVKSVKISAKENRWMMETILGHLEKCYSEKLQGMLTLEGKNETGFAVNQAYRAGEAKATQYVIDLIKGILE